MTQNQESFEAFAKVYREELPKAVAAYPTEYYYGPDAALGVAEKMLGAIKSRGINSINKDSRGLKATCKRLGIPFTYKGIAAYLQEVR